MKKGVITCVVGKSTRNFGPRPRLMESAFSRLHGAHLWAWGRVAWTGAVGEEEEEQGSTEDRGRDQGRIAAGTRN
jgi:hypothetical protein